MNARAWLLGIVLSIVVLIGCTSRFGQPGDPAAATASALALPPVDVLGNARGFWEGRAGDINISEFAVGEIYNYDWYAIDFPSSTTALVVWDNGITCTRTPATVVGNALRLRVDAVSTVFVVHDAHTATVTFQQGPRTWVKQLEKTRDDPTVVCA